jgi:glycosyltransferase involved in cell wall biosynthesis
MTKVQHPTPLLHIMTVPQSLGFIRGQPGFMQARGFVVHAITAPNAALAQFGREERAAVHAVQMQRRITPFRDLLALWQLYRTIREVKPHVVHAHTPKGGLLGMLAAWLADVPVRIYTIHGLPLMTADGWKRLLLFGTEWIACRCASSVLCVSPSICTEAIQRRLCPTAKIKVLLNGSVNGVDAQQRFNPALHASAGRTIRRQHGIPCDAMVAGYVGRIVRDKGMVELAEAWRTLRDRFPSLHLLLVGPFEPQDPVPPAVEELFRNDPRIHLTGQVDDVSPHYAAMDVCVLPTYREGLPGVLLEAAAMRVPVVATKIPGCADAVAEGVTGVLVPPRDATAIAQAMRVYLTDPELRRQHGEAGRQRVLREFRPEAIWQALYELYVDLLQQHHVPLATTDANNATLTMPTPPSERRAA